jgi:nitroimidazol reductase NimA-like FMN-containing flavoprotein (pyridoxamine 5'-phosphate oxidase superfamily)
MNETVEVLDEQRCLEYLHSANLGRVAFRAGDDVEILPVNYAWDGAIVVYRTAAGSRLELAVQGRVSFEVDGWDAERRTGWSVVLKGVARDVTAGRDPYSQSLRERKVVPLAPGRRERWIAIYPSKVTGRRFNATAWAASEAKG